MASKKKYKKYEEIDIDDPGRKDYLVLLNAYKNKAITFDVFENNFARMCQEGYYWEYFSKQEYDFIHHLNEFITWYSPYESDLEEYSGYKSKDEVENAIQETITALNI